MAEKQIDHTLSMILGTLAFDIRVHGIYDQPHRVYCDNSHIFLFAEPNVTRQISQCMLRSSSDVSVFCEGLTVKL